MSVNDPQREPENEAVDGPWLVACLCAAWCRTCDAYYLSFEQLAREFGPRMRFVKVDIEDDEDSLGDLDVVDFPTLLIAEGETIYFLGPVLPHLETARQLIARALRRELAEVRTGGGGGVGGEGGVFGPCGGALSDATRPRRFVDSALR